jgi:Fe-S cluster assembly iron-binding protein IscA
MTITATPETVNVLKHEIERLRDPQGPDTVRVMVAHQCGCGTTKFAMGLDEAQEEDSRIDLGGVTVLVDPLSAPALQDAELVVSESESLMQNRGFEIKTPQTAGGGCGCGGHH